MRIDASFFAYLVLLIRCSCCSLSCGGDIRCLLRRRRLIWDARAAVAYRAMFSMLSAVSMAGAARDGVIVVIVGGGGGGGGKRKSIGLRIVVIIEVVRERSLSLVFGRLEVDRNLNRNSFLMMMT